ncbi:MAG: LacI family DNA-binding transcriptional regulator [Anaerolineae bacterium]|nr:LacI family DNA-binding transcriptional regulator [Anaerolineae bacterium]
MIKGKPKNLKQGVTIADVAKAAGVSVPTVSRILNNKEYVAEETRDRVNQAIKQLGYVPHFQARQLRGGASQTLALHYPVESPHLVRGVVETPYITGAAAAAGEHDYFLNFLVSQLTPDTLLNMFRSNQIDGMMLLQVRLDDWRVDLLRENEHPFVMIGRCADLQGLTFIDLDFESAIISAFSHLVELGHREIGFLTYPESWRNSKLGPAVRSFEGYEHALHQHKLHPHYREVAFSSVEDGISGTHELLDENPQLTAIVTCNHMVAAGSMKALAQRGYRVPEDCSVLAIGFGEFANGTTPSLTAFEWSSYEVSYRATLMMTEKLNEPLLPAQQILVKPKLIVRESTQAAT